MLFLQRGCQTSELHNAEAGVQTIFTTISSTQTEPQDQITELLIQHNSDKPEAPGLKDFLHQVEDTVIRELARNTRSHAFDGFLVNWEDCSQLVRRTTSQMHDILKLILVFEMLCCFRKLGSNLSLKSVSVPLELVLGESFETQHSALYLTLTIAD